ncbi:ArsC family reductase [Methylococcus sp. EFPC2]|uniref:ArsC family reductase n=1 Tax=Methylococcus sp. EFPC2 TaxID=2812648 RepID=UPI001968054D|nr:ArsC family reductase [Methylococcus sp. EFPC2]QSA97039.1 ArsC family reductase [Methylococcus sp. EFPC2]
MSEKPLPVLYGIKNCDTVRKARSWLDQQGIVYRFHDFRADGLEPALLDRFEQALGWDTLLNRRGTTWRGLDATLRDGITDRESAIALMLSKPTVIKRPVLAAGENYLAGFSPDDYSRTLNEK